MCFITDSIQTLLLLYSKKTKPNHKGFVVVVILKHEKVALKTATPGPYITEGGGGWGGGGGLVRGVDCGGGSGG